jgi:glycine hydroxymethyltransferase
VAAARARELFRCGYANVQPHSGTQANQAVFFALVEPGDTVLSMSLRDGGHLSHGDPDNLSGRWFRTVRYGVRGSDGLIDYDEMDEICRREQPRLIIVGGSSYPRAVDFAHCHEIGRSVGAYLLADIAHFSGLVAAGAYPNPFPHVDAVTTSTNKNLRGPRGGLVLCDDDAIARKLHRGVFPGVQGGGPLPEYIAAKAVCFGEAITLELTDWAGAVLENARTLAAALQERGYQRQPPHAGKRGPILRTSQPPSLSPSPTCFTASPIHEA